MATQTTIDSVKTISIRQYKPDAHRKSYAMVIEVKAISIHKKDALTFHQFSLISKEPIKVTIHK